MRGDFTHIDPDWLPGVWRISAGEFTRGADYLTVRPKGRGDHLLIATIAGSGRVRSGNAEVITVPGTVVLFEPDAPQDYRTDPAAGKWRLLWAHFRARPSWQAWFDWPSPSRGFRVAQLPEGELRDRCWAGFRKARQLREAVGETRDDLALNALESAILWIREALARQDRARIDPRIRRALDRFVSDMARPFSVARAATECGLSPSRFAHLFREQVGLTPQRFAERCRLNRASELLRLGGFTVAEVAAETGFDCPFYFSNRFRKAFGKSPRQFCRETR